MNAKIAICDDIPLHSEHLRELLCADENGVHASITTYACAAELLHAMEQATYDVLFLDVELGSESGIQLAQTINERMPQAQIVFVTANITNAVDVGEANHTYFLTKPVDPQKLHSALKRALQPLFAKAGKGLKLVLPGGTEVIVTPEQMIYCERTKRITTVVCVQETLRTPFKLDMLEAELPPLLFARPHNSFLVNLMHVVKLERSAVHLDNGEILSVSNQRRSEFREAMAAYVSRV